MPVTKSNLASEVRSFVRRGFHPRFGELGSRFPANSLWQRLRELGTELWLDTGSLEEAGEIWTREFSALTTNNTLLNKEIQKGTYDAMVVEAAQMLARYDLGEHDRMLELAFILNARHGLRLVERFDAYVSVEEHTDLAGDVEASVEYARRYHAVCPERFIVKIPFTPAGLLATRRLSREGVPVNHTLGFSARQNYVIARLGRPQFVNVFLGRLNSFVQDNGLGDGSYVGEKATLSSQAVVRNLRQTYQVPSRQIGASFRAGAQVEHLSGIDVMTLPVKVAEEFLGLGLSPAGVKDKTGREYQPPLEKGVDPMAVRLDTLWEVHDDAAACAEVAEKEDLDAFTPDDLVAFFADRGCGDLLVSWSDEQIATSAEEGKIPRLDNWRDALAEKAVGLDSLMNLAGLNSFTADQKAMDERVSGLLAAR